MPIRNYQSQQQTNIEQANIEQTNNIAHRQFIQLTHQLHFTVCLKLLLFANIGQYNRRMGTAQSTERDMSAIKNHDRIGIYRLFEQKGRPLIELQRAVSSEQVYKSWASEMQRVKQRPQSCTVYLPVRYNYVRTGMCGSGGMLHIVFEQWQNFLKEEIANRRKNQHFYSEEEVWFIFYSLCKLAAIYEPQHSKLGDLHPNNIIVTSEGFLKVISRHSLPNQLDNFQKVVEEINSDVYLSPQEMDQQMIASGVYQVKHPTKADTFSLGITMLEVATLQNCSYLYIRNPLRLSLQKFRSYCNSVKGKYSQLLYNTLMSALELDPKYRKSMYEIYQALRPFGENIQEMKPFKINEGGDKSMSMQVQKSGLNAQQLIGGAQSGGTGHAQSKPMVNRKD